MTYNKDTEIYYFGARYMESKIGRFNSPDPVGAVDIWTGKINQMITHDPQRLNLYVYGLNNPSKYIDPDGEAAVLVLTFPVLKALIVSGLRAAAIIGTTYVLGSTGIEVYNASKSEGEKKSNEDRPKEGTYAPNRPLPRDERTGKPVPESEYPHTQLGKKTSSETGKEYTQGREFGKGGDHVKDVHFTDHGRKSHPNPHQHNIDPKTGKRSKANPLE